MSRSGTPTVPGRVERLMTQHVCLRSSSRGFWITTVGCHPQCPAHHQRTGLPGALAPRLRWSRKRSRLRQPNWRHWAVMEGLPSRSGLTAFSLSWGSSGSFWSPCHYASRCTVMAAAVTRLSWCAVNLCMNSASSLMGVGIVGLRFVPKTLSCMCRVALLVDHCMSSWLSLPVSGGEEAVWSCA